MKQLYITISLLIFTIKTFCQSTTITGGSEGSIQPPKMSFDQIQRINSPSKGMLVYDTTFDCLRVYNGLNWKCSFDNPSSFTGVSLAQEGSGNVGGGVDIQINQNDIYLAGEFSGTASFGGSTLVSNGLIDAFLVKYNSEGDVVWAKKCGGMSNDFSSSIAFDNVGNVYLLGSFRGSATFENITLTSSGLYDFFIAKYDRYGSFLGVVQSSGNGTEFGNTLKIDSGNNLYVCGTYTSSFTFGNTTVTTNAATNIDVFILKYDSNLNPIWIKRGGGLGYDYAKSLSIDSQNNIILVGSVYTAYANVNFNNTNFNVVDTNNDDMFCVKYDNLGNIIWIKFLGSTSTDSFNSVATDINNNIYLAGVFSGTIQIDSKYFQSKGQTDVILLKIDSNNGNMIWGKSFGGTGNDGVVKISLFQNDQLGIVGGFSDIMNIGLNTLYSKGESDAFMAKFDLNGEFIMSANIGGVGYESAQSICLRDKNLTYISGIFSGTVNIGSTILVKETTNVYYIFFAKIAN